MDEFYRKLAEVVTISWLARLIYPGMQCVAELSGEHGKVEAPALVERFVRGEVEAFGEVVALYGGKVAGLAFRLMGYRGGGAEVDDIVQEVFLAALEKRGRFRGGSSLWTWLTSITVNRCRSHWRRRRVREMGVRLLGRKRTAEAADARAIEGDTAAQVRGAVGRLAVRDREVIVLHYFERMGIGEMCELLGEKRVAVTVRLHRAREKLRGMLKESCDEG